MTIKRFMSLVLAVIATSAFADEKFPVLKVGTNVYSDVTVTATNATDIFFTHAGGMANVKLKNLSPELQKHFNYNAAKAGEVEKKRAADNLQYHNLIISRPVSRPPDESREPSAVIASTSGMSWGTDLPGALNQARTDNKMVLLDFTGSDWCPWCIKFDQEVLATGQFATYAKAKLVLVKLDFPRHTEQAATLKQANEELYKKFNADGFPTYILLSPSGKELGRQVGYAEGGPNAFIAELDGFSKR
jgi:thiol-disulfide isomerase/thioredoxin